MAKGNLFLGTAAKSVGDVVMYRREGSQVSRVRVRKIANPKTDAQCRQRSIMNAVVKFYQPLADVLARGWQGKSTAKSYAAFLKANATLARQNSWFLPKGSSFAAFPFQVSEGTLMGVDCQGTDSAAGAVARIVAPFAAAPSTVADFDNVLKQAGFKDGDIITIIQTTGMATLLDSGYSNTTKLWIGQHIVGENQEQAATTMFGGCTLTVNTTGTPNIYIKLGNSLTQFCAAIVSRPVDDGYLHTTEYMHPGDGATDTYGREVYQKYAIDSFSKNAGSASPLVYLDGSDFEPAASDGGGGDDGE